ncbi:MAG: GNAT family N-acetyltransferase [Actinomycetia bacterium]|nr:GNAT family N-acetyltransferase [Actinomycetes bacterium]
MIIPIEERRAGLEYLEAVTTLLNRIRTTHPTAGLYEAAELQWWWAQNPRTTDDLEQLFWFDDLGRPEAAVIATEWGDSKQLDPLVLPDATPDWTARVMQRGLDRAHEAGFEAVNLEVDRADDVLRAVLEERGFAIEEEGLVESWLAADARPPISPLHMGYQLYDRRGAMDRPHHMINEHRGHMDPEPRLNQMSLYRPDLDLVVYDDGGNVAAYGLFWYDPTTSVGVVEPMRTEAKHQQRGFARHILTYGIDRLARAGAKRFKICFEPDNAAAKHLYLSVGFEPDRENDIFAGPTSA